MRARNLLWVTTPVFLVALLVPLSALAQTAVAPVQGVQQWWQALVYYLVAAILGIAGPVITVLIVTLLKKKGIVVDQQVLGTLISTGVNYAEQLSAKALKENQPPLPGAEKMKQALAVVNTLAEQYKLKKLAEDKLIQLIEAKLGEKAAAPAPANGAK